MTLWHLFKLFFLNQKLKFFLISLVLFIFSAAKCFVSILMSTLIDSLEDDYEIKYAYGIALISLNFVAVICQHQFYSLGYEYSTQVRINMSNIIYAKIFKLHPYYIQNTNQGKIINMISADLNILEPFLIYMFVVFNLPFSLTMSGAVLWYRFDGPKGLLLIAILLLIYPVQLILTHRMTLYIKQTKATADQRIKLTNELIDGIRLIKMYAWQDAFIKLITTLSKREHAQYMLAHLQYMVIRSLGVQSNMWASAVFFIILHYGGLYELNISILLSTVQLAAFIRFFCVVLSSFGLDFLANLRISLERLRQILVVCDQVVPEQQDIIQSGLLLEQYKGYWQRSLNPAIEISYHFKKGIYAIVGKIGSGKTTLLHAILGQLPQFDGNIYYEGSTRCKLKIGYVEQEPFIFPASFKENVLFGRPHDETLYQTVLQQSNLVTDLRNMEKGDTSMIGEKGITLSGGQKARLALARALYEDADLYLLDDPLSAVDSKVSRSIFLHLKQLAENKIILLVTHQIQFIPECDEILILSEGKLQASGKFEELGKHFNLLSDEFKHEEQHQAYHNAVTKPDNDLYKKEEQSSKPVTTQSYIRFYHQWSYQNLLYGIIILNVGVEVILQLFFRELSLYDSTSSFFLLIGMLQIMALAMNFFKYCFTTMGVLSGNLRTHDEMINSLARAPISFFDTNPSGRLLNRFSSDKSMCDYAMNLAIWEVLELNCAFFVSIGFIISILPYFAIIISAIILIQFYFLKRSYQIVIQTKECDSIQKSPLFDFFKNTLNGIVQISVYKQQTYFKSFYNQLSNNCIRANHTFYQCSTNFGYKVHLTGQCASAIGTLVIIGISLDKSVFSQALLILTIFNDQFQWCMRQMIQVHAMMSSCQRMYEIVDQPSEAPDKKNMDAQLSAWPSKGELYFKDVELRYRYNTPLVLKGVTFKIDPGKRVGCVGRTGAGKSSILQALFRMSELEKGAIIIDGVDISTLGLTHLRSNMAIIPQSPFLFSGTIRRNIDPLGQFNEEQILRALSVTGLEEYVMGLPQGLDSDMTQVNQIFSVGQKQLICLARVVLTKRKIVVFDEATASLDYKTDDQIQSVIKKFDATIITIAHRLNTIANYDLVMVISEGRVLEIDTPLKLLCRNTNDIEVTAETEFAKMVNATGKENAKLIVSLARQRLN